MKVLIALAVLIVAVAARPGDVDAQTTRFVNSQPGPEGFNWE